MKLEELKPIWKAGYLKLIIQMTITVYYLKLKLMYRLGVYRKRRCKIYKFIHRFKSQHWLAELWEQLRVLCSPGDLSRPWGHHGVWVDSRKVTVPGIFRTFMVWGVLIGGREAGCQGCSCSRGGKLSASLSSQSEDSRGSSTRQEASGVSASGVCMCNCKIS